MLVLNDEILKFADSTELLGIYLYQNSGKIVFANKAFLNLLEYTKEDLLKIDLLQTVEDGHKEEAKKIIERRCKGESFSREFREFKYITKSGMIVPVINFGYTVIYKNKPSGLVFVVDLLKQKTYESLLRITNEIIETAESTLSEQDLLRRIVEILVEKGEFDLVSAFKKIKNDVFKLLSIKHKNTKIESIFANFGIKPEAFGLKEAIKKKVPISINTILLDKEKKKKLGLSVCTIPITVDNKNEYLITIFSRTKNIFSEQLKHYVETLHFLFLTAIEKIRTNKVNKILNTVINENFDLVVITDENFNIEYTNSSFPELLGKKEQDVIGNKINNFIKDINISELNHSHSQMIQLRVNGEYRTFFLHISSVSLNRKYFIFAAKNTKENPALNFAIETYLKKDQLTGLPNRKAFIDSIKKFIQRARHKKTIGAILIIDPANFSKINEAYGFQTGDEILIKISKRLISFLRDYDIVSKLESERFGVLLKDIEREEDIYVVAFRLLKLLSKPYQTQRKKINIGFNIGIGVYPSDSTDPEDLINKSHIAIEDAKLKGEGSIGFYREDLKVSILKRLKIQEESLDAMEKGELKLFLQPYYSVLDYSAKGAEALVRWIKKNHTISPGEFIPVLEQAGLIQRLDRYMTNKVLTFLSNRKSSIPISLNISPDTLHDDTYVEYIIEEVKNRGLKNLMNVEITERTFMKNLDSAIEKIIKLKNNGIGVLIDDFGTGYSSLSYLSQLPVDYVKIDISFVRKVSDDAKTYSIVKTIIYLAKELGMKTIAEGVENKNQIKLLKQAGCDYLQGFYFSKPVPAEKIIVTPSQS